MGGCGWEDTPHPSSHIHNPIAHLLIAGYIKKYERGEEDVYVCVCVCVLARARAIREQA